MGRVSRGDAVVVRPLNEIVRRLVNLRNRIRWVVQPAPWRGLKVLLAATVVAMVGAGIMFVVPALTILGAVIFFAGWLVGIAGLIGHFRWFFATGGNAK